MKVTNKSYFFRKVRKAKGMGNTGCLNKSGPFWSCKRGLCYPDFMVKKFGTLYLEERRDA